MNIEQPHKRNYKDTLLKILRVSIIVLTLSVGLLIEVSLIYGSTVMFAGNILMAIYTGAVFGYINIMVFGLLLTWWLDVFDSALFNWEVKTGRYIIEPLVFRPIPVMEIPSVFDRHNWATNDRPPLFLNMLCDLDKKTDTDNNEK